MNPTVGSNPSTASPTGVDLALPRPVSQPHGPAGGGEPVRIPAQASPTESPRRDGTAFETVKSDALGSSIGAHVTLSGGLSEIRARARQIQAELGDQPLPISNQSSRVILKLFGG